MVSIDREKMDLWFSWGSKSSCKGEFQGKRVPQVGELVQPASSAWSVLPQENRATSTALSYVAPLSLRYWLRTRCDLRPQRNGTCATANWPRRNRLCRRLRATWRASLELPRDGTEARIRGAREETDAEPEDSSASLLRFIEGGPLAAVTPAPVSPSRLLSRWRAWGDFLFKELALDETQETSRVRVYHFYLPIFAWCLDVVNRLQRESRRKHHGVIIGMQCPQGGGKTTLTTALQKLFTLERLGCVSLSIDDFYLTRREQEALARAFPENPLLESRGNPGTHDISLALQTLDQLVTAPLTKDESRIAVPRYDKSAFQGRGDRASPETWQSYERPVDVVFLEGWCLGFRPLELHHRSVEMDPVSLRNLMQVDRFLAQDFCRLYPLLDAFIVIALDGPNLAESLQTVYQWRLEAERQMRAAGRPAMTDEQVYAFVDKFMPAYRAYLSDLYCSPPLTGDASRELRVGIDRTRAPTRQFPWPQLHL